METWEWAWLAGLFEGEGSISFHGVTCVTVRIGMTDEDVIDSCHRLFPTASTWRQETKGRRLPLYVWKLSSRDEVRDFLTGIEPFMHSRRAKRLQDALTRLDKNPGTRALRQYCPQGHPLSGDNLYIAKTTGARSCLTCRQQRTFERNERDKILRAANPKPRGRQMQEVCRQGHPLSGSNLYVSPHGKRRCRACHARRERERSERFS